MSARRGGTTAWKFFKNLLFVVFVGGLGAYMTALILEPWWDHVRSRTWATVPVTAAKLVRHERKSAKGPRSEAWCHFSVRVNGDVHANRQHLQSPPQGCDGAKSAWVNPGDPGDALIFRGISSWMLLSLQFLGVLFPIVGLAIVGAILGKEGPASSVKAGLHAAPPGKLTLGGVPLRSAFWLLAILGAVFAIPQLIATALVACLDESSVPRSSLYGFLPTLLFAGLAPIRDRILHARASSDDSPTPQSGRRSV